MTFDDFQGGNDLHHLVDLRRGRRSNPLLDLDVLRSAVARVGSG